MTAPATIGLVPCPLCGEATEVAVAPGARQATCDACGRPLLLDRPLRVDDAAFDDAIAAARVPVLVDFYADWCAPCRMTAPLLDELAWDAAGRALVLKMDIDQNPDVALRLGIRSIPTLVAFNDGRETGREVGMPTPARLRELVNLAP